MEFYHCKRNIEMNSVSNIMFEFDIVSANVSNINIINNYNNVTNDAFKQYYNSRY